jgi:flavin reductase (DIM6/NTAB) family NADH-FMN oxidoreductase RutF
MPVDRDRYRQLAGSFPTGVTIVTTVDANGAPRGLTTQSFIGLSQDPPLVLVAIDKGARTLAALKRARGFVVNFVRYGADDVATRFASKSDDKFAGLAWRASAIADGAPILHELAVAYAECRTVTQHEAGDHWIFIAEVEGGEHLGGAPLMYYHRTYAAWPEEKPAPQVG